MESVTSQVPRTPAEALEKSPTGIQGFDEISRGGLPMGRVTLVMGGPGTGKTLFALETVVNGARHLREPAVFIAFEENSRQIIQNAATFGWDLPGLMEERLFFLDARLSPSVVQSGDFDLEAMLAALGAKIAELGARRVVFDGIDVLLGLLDDPSAERREIYRIYDWLQHRQLTGIITAKADERDRPTSERYAFMQFMVDCVVLLQHRVSERVSLRTVRVTKYRGSGFSENEFPLVISDVGIEVSTFGGSELDYPVFTDRLPTGVQRLDSMLAGGYFRGSSVLVSGAPGTAKTTLAGAFTAASCAAGLRTLFVSFDEAGAQVVRNLRSVSIDLETPIARGLLEIHSMRTEARGAEQHLLELRKRVERLRPEVLVLDPVSALQKTGGLLAASHAALRLLDFARAHGITVLCTSLVATDDPETESTYTQISTIADTWIHLAYAVRGGERNRTLTVVKSRGTRHSNQVRELILSDDGISLADVYTAGGDVLVGTARWEKEAELREAERDAAAQMERRRTELELAEAEIGARIAALQRELSLKRMDADAVIRRAEDRVQRSRAEDAERVRLRSGDPDTELPRLQNGPDSAAA